MGAHIEDFFFPFLEGVEGVEIEDDDINDLGLVSFFICCTLNSLIKFNHVITLVMKNRVEFRLSSNYII